MRSPSSLLLSLLKDADASPPDFLCPCDAQPVTKRRRHPHASSSRLAQDHPPPPARPRSQPHSRAYDPDRFPRQYVQGPDGFYTLQTQYKFNGQSVTCSAQQASGTRTPTNIDLSSDNGGDTYDSTAPTEVPVVDASFDSGMNDTLPKGWNTSTGLYPDRNVVIASTVLAAVLAAFLFGLILWRRPLAKRRRTQSNDKLRKLWEEDGSGSLEKGIPGRDEDPDLSRSLRSRKRAFARALLRWKSKAKGKAAHHMKPRHFGASTVSLHASQPASRLRTPHPSSPSSSSVSLPSQTSTRASSPAPSDLPQQHSSVGGENDTRDPRLAPSLTVDAQESSHTLTPPSPPSSPPPALARQQQAPAHQHLPDAAEASVAGSPVHTAPVSSPPAYRRSYTAQVRAGSGPAAGASASEIAPDSYGAGDRKQALPPASPPPPHVQQPLPILEDEAGDDPESVGHVLPPPTSGPYASDAGRDQARHFAHVATDDKSVLASIAFMASAPDDGHAGDATAPIWDDDPNFEYETLDDSVLAGPSAPTVPSSPPPPAHSGVLPQPPPRVPQRSLLEFASAPPVPDPPDGGTGVAPSAPPDAFEDDGDLLDSALSGSMVNLPRYER